MILKKQVFNSLAIVAVLTVGGCSSSSDSTGDEAGTANTVTDATTNVTTDTAISDTATSDIAMTYFLTSVGPGDGGNLGGLAGADAYCANLAEAAGTMGGEWRAYLSTTGADGINAIERIGTGPWVNANGITVATNTENLLSEDNNLAKETSITENAEIINGRGDTPNRHDILTGTQLNGLASTETGDSTCGNWTSNSTGSALVGHHDRVGGGDNSTSWSTAHSSAGCSQTDLEGTGGDGLYYCFAMN